MNSWEINKIAGAVLGSLAFVLGLSVISDVIFHETAPSEPGYRVEIPDETDTEVAEAPAETPFAVLLASADPSAGERDARVCMACHSFEEGGPTKVGPNLWNIVGNDMLHVADYSYSGAFQAFGAGKKWNYDELNQFLENPQGYIPGTSMAYAGIKDDEKRADVIAYLRSISPDAPPLPEPPEETEVAAADPTATGGTATDAGAAAPAAAGASFASLVAAADPSAGERGARVCAACHSFDEGGPTKVGPNLYGIVGAPIGHVADYSYSPAMEQYAQEHGDWTVDLLDAYLENPMGAVPGTRMAYAGIKDEEKRAEVVAYLRSISPNAPPLDTGGTATAAAGDATGTATDAAAGPAPTAVTTPPDAAPGTQTSGGSAADVPTPAASTDPATEPDTGDVQTTPATDTAPAADGSAPAADQAADGSGATDAPAPADTSGAADAAGGDQASAGDAAGGTQVAAAPAADTATAGGDGAAGAPAGDAGDELAAFVQLVREANPADAPASVTAVCQACHSVDKGGATMVGPNLWNVVGGPVLHVNDFNYSDAFKAFAEEHPVWTIAELDKYLADPMGYIPGTMMAYAGVQDEKQRAAVIAWLRSLSDDPVSLDDPKVVGTLD